MSGQEIPLKVSGSTNLPFRKKKPIKLEISTFSLQRNSPNFTLFYLIYLFIYFSWDEGSGGWGRVWGSGVN